jgi:hypothetical protein
LQVPTRRWLLADGAAPRCSFLLRLGLSSAHNVAADELGLLISLSLPLSDDLLSATRRVESGLYVVPDSSRPIVRLVRDDSRRRLLIAM